VITAAINPLYFDVNKQPLKRRSKQKSSFGHSIIKKPAGGHIMNPSQWPLAERVNFALGIAKSVVKLAIIAK
jgi:hypothetical protein